MDYLILSGKLESLRRCIKRIEDKKPVDVDHLIQDPDLQDILVLNLTRAVQLSVDIGSHIISDTDETAPQTMGEVFTTLNKIDVISLKTCEQLKKAVGFRNIAVHNYETINWEIVYAICEQFLDDFRRFSQEISLHAAL
jgi:uncharacterized protein YutE (UPF0331/DUF86 family)